MNQIEPNSRFNELMIKGRLTELKTYHPPSLTEQGNLRERTKGGHSEFLDQGGSFNYSVDSVYGPIRRRP